ncbi:hypothetical protein DYB25_008988 [Aphanomyces astaci]|uniref:Core-binding (CB) domain-containing protein n=1 Tax=Aphanomyces astaci TaxID=112090 RepID=A0A397ARC5_APHAT|nr:hypothetical protein DYB25_008988 [Aphanomyces astaci]
MEETPTKQTIQASFRGASTRRTYATYQKQFEAFCATHKQGTDPVTASTEDCTDFFHHLYSLGRKARTIDSAKTALVAYFKDNNVEPNPAQASESKQYVVGLQKYNRQNNVDDETKAHPLTIHELSTLMNGFASLNPFLGALYRFMLSCCYLGCFRMGEMLALKWNDVALGSGAFSADSIAASVVKLLRDGNALAKIPQVAITRQTTIQEFAVPRAIPTARSGKEAWDQWFSADPKVGLYCALKDYTKEMIKVDRRKYSERLTLAVAFSKYQNFSQFETEYAGHASTYSGLLQEVRKRKRENTI